MIQRGIIEKVIVPSKQKKSSSVKCFRLLNVDSHVMGDDDLGLPDVENDLDAAETGKVTCGHVSSQVH